MTLHVQPEPRLAAPTPQLVARLTEIVGPEHALTDPDQQLPYLREMRDQWFGKSALVLRPSTVEQVSRIVALCNDARVAIVPQAGNTGLVGGQVPYEHGAEIVLSTARMKAVRSVDGPGYAMTVEAGLTLAECQQVAEKAGRLFPLSLPSEGSCQIGGNIATNAGGVAVLAYGNTRAMVLGLEVVLADGRIWNGLKALKKDNTGYDLRDLMIGSEGTLGIITAAVLKLFPRPAEKATAFLALPDLDTALELFTTAQDAAGGALTAFEFISQSGLALVAKHVSGARMPFANDHPWCVLMEISGAKPDGAAEAQMERLLEDAAERGLIVDAVLARSMAQAADIWKLRETMPEAQKVEGGSVKHDVSVAIARIPEFIRRGGEIVERVCPGARPMPFGHFGDGNIHYNIQQPVGMDKARFMALGDEMNMAVHELVADMGGSISAEHGIGRYRRSELARLKSPVELDMMRAIKHALDPNGILNPAKVV
jgi:FAD/FMN-containing dehydrogenase